MVPPMMSVPILESGRPRPRPRNGASDVDDNGVEGHDGPRDRTESVFEVLRDAKK